MTCVSSQEFSFLQVWSNDQQPLLCSFSLQRCSPASVQLSCKISVRQVKGHEQILQVCTAVAEVRLRPLSPSLMSVGGASAHLLSPGDSAENI